MALFGIKKEKPQHAEPSTPSRYKVLGSGCQKCNLLSEHVGEALRELGKDDGVEHVTDVKKIASYGVMSTPALVIDDEVVSIGRVLSAAEVKKLIEAR